MNPIAEELNETIRAGHPALFSLLSTKGKNIFFPTKGIMAQTADAAGKKWNATIGIALEDDGTPMRLPSLDGHIDIDPKGVYPYANSYGKKEFREFWRTHIYEQNPSLKAEISMPVVTSGLTHALSMAMYVFLDPGEKLYLQDLFWGNYNLMFGQVYGVEFETFNTFKGDGLDLDAMRESLSKEVGKKVLLLNFPNNPSGYTQTEEEAEQIVEIIRERAEAGDQLAVILDDAYFGLVYEDGVAKESLVGALASLHENVVVVKIDGPTKEDYVWGFRVGCFSFAGKGMTEEVFRALEAKVAGAVRATVSNVSHLGQSLLLASYESPSYAEEKREKYETLQARYRIVKEILSDPKYEEFFTPLPFNSGYFMCVELKEGFDAEAIRHKLLDEYDTGLISMGNKFRVAYSAIPKSNIPSFFENLFQACSTSVLSHV